MMRAAQTEPCRKRRARMPCRRCRDAAFDDCSRRIPGSTSSAFGQRDPGAASWPEIDWRMRRRARSQPHGACLPCASRPRARICAPQERTAAGRAAWRRERGDLRWGQTYTRRRFRPALHRQLRLAGAFRHARPFRQRQDRGRLPDPRSGHRLSRPSPCCRGDLHAADRRHRMAQGRRARFAVRAAGEIIHHRLQRQPRHAHRRRSRCWRSISGAAGRWPRAHGDRHCRQGGR